jgi:hypothetical protein
VRYIHRITVRSIAQHLTWKQCQPTSFISLFDDLKSALREARRRMSQRHVELNGKLQPRGAVFVAVISAKELADAGVFVFSTQDLKSERMLGLEGMASSHPLTRMLNEREWFVMDWIPESAVECVVGEDALARVGME